MIEGLLLQQRLDAVRDALRQWKRRRALVRPLWAGAIAAVLMLGMAGGREWWWSVLLLAVVGLWILMARWVAERQMPDDLALARLVEREDVALDSRLVTAVEILEKPRLPGEELAFLEQRVIADALRFQDGEAWVEYAAGERLRKATRWAGVALAVFLLSWFGLTLELGLGWLRQGEAEVAEAAVSEEVAEKQPEQGPLTFEVTPGDAEVELGTRLVVEAKTQPTVPAEATLVWRNAAGSELGRRALSLGVDGVTFGGMVPRVQEELSYWIEAGGSRSKAFQVTVFEYPKLERFDVLIVPPAYTALPEREVKNTRKVSAPVQSKLRFRVKINKPVAEAELFGEDKQIIALKATAEDATVLVGEVILEKTQKYRLHLVDDRERANVKPPWITLTALENALAKIEVVFPKRDLQVSALQELPVEARVWDDVGVTRSGATVNLAGSTREFVFEHAVTGANEKYSVAEQLDLEAEGVLPRQLVSYFFWAEDRGAKGEVRRAMSDMFFAQVRPFDDIFRETEAPPPSPGKPGQTLAGKLVELQKQVVNATWKIIRNTAGGQTMDQAERDVGVVKESEAQALEQVKEQMEEVEDPEVKTALTEAWKSMRDALESLEIAQSGRQRAALMQSLEHEQAALQWLYQASEREHLVAKQNPRSPSQGGGAKEQQEQLMNLELKQEEQRYEEEKLAQAEQSAQQQENLEVLNRLKELAKRQEALAKKMQELREQMAQAESEEQRQELSDQLERLKEEQQDLLAGLDDLQDQLEQSERKADLAETREQLEQAREQADQAAEELGKEELAGAANAATRAQRELEQIQQDFREKTARRFSEEMKQMKQQAQQVAQAQEKISEALENQKTPSGAERGDTSNSLERMLSGAEVSREISEQQERVQSLMESMQELSEQAEGSEPILSRRLYEAVRGAQTSGLEEQLEEARRQSRYGERAGAQEAERKATTAVEQLAKNVEKAAEAVLGSEAEALRMARSELDQLIEEAENEAKAEQAGQQGKAGEEGKGEKMAQADQSGGEGKEGEEGEGEKMAQAGQAGKAGARSGGEANSGGGGQGGWFFDEPTEQVRQGPFSGEGYRDWSERLATVEELLTDPELANEAARVADDARALRLESRRNNEPPAAATLKNRITAPLVELRDRVTEELARKTAKDSVVPIDRDPVPPTFRELVRKYYSELGKGE